MPAARRHRCGKAGFKQPQARGDAKSFERVFEILAALREMRPAVAMNGNNRCIGKACAVSIASLAFMVRLNGPRVRAEPPKRMISLGLKRRATSATPSYQTVSPVT